MSVAAVVFDLDGVIIDSEPLWEEVRRRFVADCGGQWAPDTQRRLMGMSTGEWSAYLSGELGVGMPAGEVAKAVIERMVERYRDAIPEIAGAVQVVRDIGASWPLGLASSSPRRLIDSVLEGTGLIEAFSVTVSTEEVARGKPSADVYLAVAQKLGVPPARCVAVEDSNNGILAAVAAGMCTVAVERPEYPLDKNISAAAALRLTGIEQLTPTAVAGMDVPA